MWLILGVYNTGERLFKMEKMRSPYCILCTEMSTTGTTPVDNREHFLLSCTTFSDIREDFLSQFLSLSPTLINHMEVSSKFLFCLLDPYSSLVPEDVRGSWVSEEAVYPTSRNFCYAIT